VSDHSQLLYRRDERVEALQCEKVVVIKITGGEPLEEARVLGCVDL
jgi:hypothetical protein